MLGSADNLNLEVLFGKGKKSSLDKVDANVNHRKCIGGLPLADCNSFKAVVLQTYKSARLYFEGYHRHQNFIAIELQTWEEGISFQLQRNMRNFPFLQDNIKLLPVVTFALRLEGHFYFSLLKRS
jgi:hypothetical protein